MKNTLKHFIFSIAVFLCGFNAYSQQVEITGVVTDEGGVPILGANILLVGTTVGTQTDFDGKYSIQAKEGQKLQCSFIGMKTKTITIGTASTYDFVLKEDLLGLDEVIVTGTSGLSTKKQLGSSISTVGEEALNTAKANVSIGEALQGKIAGAQISRNSGNPSGGISIRLRGASTLVGSSDPLYIIDGVIVNNSSSSLIDLGGYQQNRLVDINTDDIERVEVLKGAAAAAIYGSRASNGVVQIFTKRGKKGKPKIVYSTSVNLNKLRKELPYNDTQLKWDGDNAVAAKRYDYQDYIFEDAMGYENALNISGGTDKTTYLFSASQYKNDGIVKNTSFDRKTLKLRLDQSVAEWAKLSVGSFMSANKSNDIPNGKNYGPITSLIFADNLNDASPDEFGNYPSVGWMSNPYEVVDRVDATTTNFRSINDIQLKLFPLKGLNVNYTLGYDHSNSEGLIYIPNGFNTRDNGLSIKAKLVSNLINSDINVSYRFDINEDITSTTGAGYSYQYEKYDIFRVENDLVSPIPGVIVTQPDAAVKGADYRTKASFWGGFLQQSFSYKDKLFLTFAGRLDGASTFGEDERNQFYPKVSASYSISDEDYFKNSLGSVFNTFKLRAAWGQAGNLTALDPFQIFTNYDNSVYNGNIGFTPSTTQGNANLKPERQTEFEIGLDASILDDRIGFEFTYYKQEIEDLLIKRPLSPSTGFGNQFANIGTMENKGFEIMLKAIPIKTEDFDWDITGTFSKNENVTPYVEGVRTSLGMFGTSVAQSGEALGVFYGTFFARDNQGNLVLDANGNVQKALGRYEDKTLANGQVVQVPVQEFDSNGQPTGTTLRKIIGDPNPDFIASVTNSFKYKNFGFRFQFDISQGNDVMSWDKRMAYRFAGGKFIGDELRGDVPKGSSAPNFGIFESFIEDGSYIKLREIAFSYDLMVKKSYLNSIKFNLSATNLFSIDDYFGFDPEVNTEGQSNGVRGQDMANVPIPQVFKLGVIFNF